MANDPRTDEPIPGPPEMDREHRQMLELLDRVIAVAETDSGNDSVVDTLARLAEFARLHFISEEDMMESMAYSAREAHIAAHRGLLVQLHVLIDVIADGTMEPNRHTLDFISSWLLDHMHGLDRDFARYHCAWSHNQTLQCAIIP